MGISITSSGSFDKTDKFLAYLGKGNCYKNLDLYARRGVSALAAATPVDSGATAEGWSYILESGPGYASIWWINTHVDATRDPVAILSPVRSRNRHRRIRARTRLYQPSYQADHGRDRRRRLEEGAERMSGVDQRFVEMAFKGDSFLNGVKNSLNALKSLKEGLNSIKGGEKDLNALDAAGKKFSLGNLTNGVQEATRHFSLMRIAGLTAFTTLVHQAVFTARTSSRR